MTLRCSARRFLPPCAKPNLLLSSGSLAPITCLLLRPQLVREALLPSELQRAVKATITHSTKVRCGRQVFLHALESNVPAAGAPDAPHPSPTTLCPFCSCELPPNPSAELTAILADLKNVARRSPTLHNPLAMSLPMSQSMGVCGMHRAESRLFPYAKSQGWPFDIDWKVVECRARDQSIVLSLCGIVVDKNSSVFYVQARDMRSSMLPGALRTVQGQARLSERSRPG